VCRAYPRSSTATGLRSRRGKRTRNSATSSTPKCKRSATAGMQFRFLPASLALTKGECWDIYVYIAVFEALLAEHLAASVSGRLRRRSCGSSSARSGSSTAPLWSSWSSSSASPPAPRSSTSRRNPTKNARACPLAGRAAPRWGRLRLYTLVERVYGRDTDKIRNRNQRGRGCCRERLFAPRCRK
jgi:hypothetical protein